MRVEDFLEKLRLAERSKTLYVKGCFGAPLNPANKARYTKNLAYNKNRAAMINAASLDTFGFDCVCLIKGILWGWDADGNAMYGGAKYCANGVPDTNEDGMRAACGATYTDFSGIVPGALVWMSGHVGIYIGDGLVIECSPKWKNGVQVTACGNVGARRGYNTRMWTVWGKLPWIEYEEEEVRYKFIDDIPSEESKKVLNTLVEAGVLHGKRFENEKRVVDLSDDMVRNIVFEYRGGAFDRALIAKNLEPAVKI